jgi:hypothetical protein
MDDLIEATDALYAATKDLSVACAVAIWKHERSHLAQMVEPSTCSLNLLGEFFACSLDLRSTALFVSSPERRE